MVNDDVTMTYDPIGVCSRSCSPEKKLDILIEECSELIKAACKLKRTDINYNKAFDNFIEELADVELMIAQMKEIYHIYRDVNDVFNSKLDRMIEKIEVERYYGES